MERLSSRKFILAVLCCLSAQILCYLGKIDAGVYQTVMVATVGAYLAANVFQKTTETTKKSVE